MSRWFRFYADAMRNPKVMRLSDKDYRLWTRLLAVASERDGHIPPIEDLKLILAMRLDHVDGGLNRLISGMLIDVLDVGYTPHDWDKHQYKSDTSAERVAKHRAKRNVTVTPPDTDTDTDTDKEKKEDDVVARASELDFDALNLADEAARAAGVRHIAPGDIIKNGNLIREWLKAGADPPAILDCIRADRVKADAPTITSLKFFDAAIRRAIAQKEATANGHSTRPMDQRTGAQPVYRSNPALDRYRQLVRELEAEADEGSPRLHN